MVQIPLEVLLSWPQPNYVDPETRGPALIIVNAIFISLCTITLFLRLYTRIFIKRWFGSDDISTVGLTTNVIIAHKHYFWSRHVWDIPVDSFPAVLKVAFSAKLIFVFAATFTRQSLLCFYYRLIADAGMLWFTWILHVTVFLNAACAITFTCLGIWLCVPISAYWTLAPSPSSTFCLPEGPVVLTIGITNTFLDALTTLLPLPLLTRLHMPLAHRLATLLLFSLGLVVVVAGAVRSYYIHRGLIRSYDQTWLTFPLWIAAAVEINLGVICACAPALRPLAPRYLVPAFGAVARWTYHRFPTPGGGSDGRGPKVSAKLSARFTSTTAATDATGDHEPLEILYRRSFELAHLDRSVAAAAGGDGSGDGSGDGEEGLELDPRGRAAGGRAAFGCVAAVEAGAGDHCGGEREGWR